MAIEPTAPLTAGTRVQRTTPDINGDYALGTVRAITSDTITVATDAGGTSSAPLHFKEWRAVEVTAQGEPSSTPTIHTPYAASFPAASTSEHWVDRVVTQGHADYCKAHGHATHTIDGVVQPQCPRCGDVLEVVETGPVEAHSYTEPIPAPTCTNQPWCEYPGHSDRNGYSNCVSAVEPPAHENEADGGPSAPAILPTANRPFRRPRPAGYLVVQAMDYKDDPSSFKFCATRAAVELELVDFGYLDNPGVQVFVLSEGDVPTDVITSLVVSSDPYPDFVVERGPRGGVQWNRA